MIGLLENQAVSSGPHVDGNGEYRGRPVAHWIEDGSRFRVLLYPDGRHVLEETRDGLLGPLRAISAREAQRLILRRYFGSEDPERARESLRAAMKRAAEGMLEFGKALQDMEERRRHPDDDARD